MEYFKTLDMLQVYFQRFFEEIFEKNKSPDQSNHVSRDDHKFEIEVGVAKNYEIYF